MLESLFSCLMCPYCGDETPPELELHVLSSSKLKDDVRIHEGIVHCRHCTRFYVINDEILFMSMDNLRDAERESRFLQKWHEKLPEHVLKTSRLFSEELGKKT